MVISVRKIYHGNQWTRGRKNSIVVDIMGNERNIHLITKKAKDKLVKSTQGSATSLSAKNSVEMLTREAGFLHRNGWREQKRAAQLERLATGIAIIGVGAELIGRRKISVACAGAAVFLAGAEVLTLASEGYSFEASNQLTYASEKIRLGQIEQTSNAVSPAPTFPE